MIGRVDIVVSETKERMGAGFVLIKIMRATDYHYRKRDLYAETREERYLAREERNAANEHYTLPEIFNIIKDKLNLGSDYGTRKNVIQRSRKVTELYEAIPKAMNILQKRMPCVVFSAFKQTTPLLQDIESVTPRFDGTRGERDEKVMGILQKAEDVLMIAREKMEHFWKKNPELLLALPHDILIEVVSRDLFLSPLYLPFTTGQSELPKWVDPELMTCLNEARTQLELPPHPKLVMTPEMFLQEQMIDGEVGIVDADIVTYNIFV